MPAAPQIVARRLTFNFASSVSGAGVPDVMTVSVLPLNSAANPTAGATFAGGPQTQTVELTAPVNSVGFDLIPSYAPGLSAPVLYRVMWRAGVNARTYTYDFAMPDEDVTWDALVGGVANLITGTSYLQQTDLGVAGRVARLDTQGHVVDANGNQVATLADLTTIQNNLAVEIVNRERATGTVQSTIQVLLDSQVGSTLGTARSYTDSQITTVAQNLAGEVTSRTAADTALQSQITANQSTLSGQVGALNTQIAANTTALAARASLDNTGHVPLSQIPATALSNAVTVANQTAMLNLTSSQVSTGQFALRPDGAWLLTGDTPGLLANWTRVAPVASVNGYTGQVSLVASDVGAIPTGGAVAMSQVTGLSSALSGYTPLATTNALSTLVQGVLTDTTIVRTSGGGVIPVSLMPPTIALVNASGQVTNKSGVVVAAGSGGGGGVSQVNGYSTPIINLSLTDVASVGGTISESQVTGLSTDLGNRVLSSDARLSDARTPTAHAASHASTGSDPVTLAAGQVTGLSSILSGNQLTGTTNAVNRVGSLENRVTNLETAGTGGGSGTAATTAIFYSSATTNRSVTDFSQVGLKSPWGIDSDGTITGTVGNWYYLYSGVRSADAAYASITPGGHLALVRWNESNAADPSYATTAALAGKASQADLTALTSTVTALSASAASQAQVTTLAGTGGLVAKANQSDLSSAQSAISALQTQASTLATAASVSALAGSKASQSDMTAAQASITALQASDAGKASLVSGVVPLSQTNQAIPVSYVSGLANYLTHLNSSTGTFDAASLTNLANTPAGIPQASVAGLSASLSAKADLVNGYLSASEIPPQIAPQVVQVANRAAMLALSTAHIGTVCQITATADAGTYILKTADPTQSANWIVVTATATTGVTTVNGYAGPSVTLGASDVGALAANAQVAAYSAATGSPLATQLATFATTTSVATVQSQLTTPAQVQTILSNSTTTKRADYVCTTSGGLSGLPPTGSQSVNGVVPPNGSIVLLTTQASGVYNGLWVVNTAGNWTRPASYATASYIVRDTLILVSNQNGGTSGSLNYTVWQQTAASGVIDTNATTWLQIGQIAPVFTPVAGNGVTVSGSTISAAVAASVANPSGSGPVLASGLISSAAGLYIDPSTVSRKYAQAVPSGNTLVTVTHNLGTYQPSVDVWDTTTNTLVLVGVSALTANSIQLEFASAPASGQYVVKVRD